MPADRSDAACTVAGVRKPSRNPREIAGGGAASAERYGGLRSTELREGNRRRWVCWLTTLRHMIGRSQVRESAVSQGNRRQRARRKGRFVRAPPLRIEGRRGRSGFWVCEVGSVIMTYRS